MSELPDPVAAGVASVLKSLRMCAGLQEDRLSGTELALDTLIALDSVREFMTAGETAERAIVRAVRAAAGTLDPTSSIVVDVSLGLELSARLIDDAELYAPDLEQRRDALLRNWDRLHQLRSVPSAKRPSARALLLEVESDALAALAMALTSPGGPSAGYARPPARRVPSEGEAQQPAGTLSEVFREIADALRGCLTRTPDGTPLGWPYDLRQLSARPRAVSTAYGLKTMLLLEDDLAPDLVPVVGNLWTMSSKGRCITREKANPRPEVAASVIDALHRVDGTADFAPQVAAMRDDLGDFEKSRPFILTTMLETSLRLRGAEELTRLLAESLLQARRPYGSRLLWPEKCEPLLIDLAPSLAHTARAVRALSRLQSASPGGPLRDAVEQGVSWLLEQSQFQNASDVVDRPVGGLFELLHTRHFTAAWVVKALVSAGVPATHPTVGSAVSQVWDSYADTAALWKWGNGDLPAWMTFDAVEALRLVSLAVPASPLRLRTDAPGG